MAFLDLPATLLLPPSKLKSIQSARQQGRPASSKRDYRKSQAEQHHKPSSSLSLSRNAQGREPMKSQQQYQTPSVKFKHYNKGGKSYKPRPARFRSFNTAGKATGAEEPGLQYCPNMVAGLRGLEEPTRGGPAYPTVGPAQAQRLPRSPLGGIRRRGHPAAPP